MTFCTVINCMDGRTQLPVNQYLQERFKAEFVDTITEPGPNRILAEAANHPLLTSILNRLKISIEKHHSQGIAVVGHHDCAGNPTSKEEQIEHLKSSLQWLKKQFKDTEIIALWVDEKHEVEELQI